MKYLRLLSISFLMTFIIWGTVSWPLPLHTFSGIPASHNNSEKSNVRTMIPGDHLQFLYHMWLARDTLFGPTPLFYNLYEFNRGNTEERKDTGMQYYLPFTLVYSVCSIAGHSAGWNGTGFAALFFTFLFTLLLARRYAKDEYAPYFAAALSIIFPYRWITLLGGSPTGLSMMWVPIAFYGLDVMVRDRKPWGAALAGAAIFFSGWSDPHVTFFTALCTPCWCILCYLFNEDKIIPTKDTCIKFLKAAVPLLVFVIFIILQAKGTKSGLENTAIGDQARSIREVALFSPHLGGIWGKGNQGMDSHIYIGWFMTVLLSIAMLITGYKAARKKVHPVKILLTSGLLFVGMVVIVILALGINNPIGGSMTWLRLCRFVPPYGMIRQPAKIFVVLPVIMAIFTAITLPQVFAIDRIKNKTMYIYMALALLLAIDYGKRFDPTICRLDTKQMAYAAVAEDAKSAGKPPMAMGIPLWPGDSHWTSLNQFYSTLYRVRMVNGYRPTRRQTYFEDIYMRFESFNKGGYTVGQLENLKDRGVDYIILQEDAFPEKVSPFPVSFVINRLLQHPNIKLLKQDGPVWAFKIVKAPEGIYEDLPDWSNYHFPARLWQAERAVAFEGTVKEDSATSGGKYLALSASTNSFMATGPYPMTPCTNLCYMIRARGDGPFTAYTAVHDNFATTELTPESEWTWHKVDIPVTLKYPMIQLRLNATTNKVDIDLIVLTTDDWNPNSFDEKITIPAPAFFHAGYTDLATGEVVLSPDREPADAIFYGPKLPFPAGKYKITMDYSSPAEMGTTLGILQPRYPAGNTKPTEVIADEPGELIYDHTQNLRLAMDFKYNREAEVRIKSVTIEKMKTEN